MTLVDKEPDKPTHMKLLKLMPVQYQDIEEVKALCRAFGEVMDINNEQLIEYVKQFKE